MPTKKRIQASHWVEDAFPISLTKQQPAPEDCGRPFGFAEYLAAMANPRCKRHQELMQWRGRFDPLAFDPQKATREMRKHK